MCPAAWAILILANAPAERKAGPQARDAWDTPQDGRGPWKKHILGLRAVQREERQIDLLLIVKSTVLVMTLRPNN